MMWKNFFYFSKKERQGVLVLMILILIIFTVRYFFSRRDEIPKNLTGLEINDTISEDMNKTHETESYNMENQITLRRFDPNTADSLTLTELGIKPKVVSIIIKYRKKGGKFYKSEDFAKIYGISDEKFRELKDYIVVEGNTLKIKSHSFADNNQKNILINKDSILKNSNHSEYQKQEKLSLGMKIDINLADTAELRKIPGIGQSYAVRILKYRKMLGGFYSVDQVKEVYGIDDEIFANISLYMIIYNCSLNAINVNNSSLDRLKAHPYMNFYQAKAIIEMRKKKGRLQDISELSLLEEFTETDLDRLRNYLSFD